MISLHALHGFLGKSTDWDDFQIPLIAHNILDIAPPTESLESWAKKFNVIAAQSPSPRIVMGYSLGGRLAMRALISNPEIWHGAIIISADPGLSDEVSMKQKMEKNQYWAKRFENDSWESLMQSWEEMEIFKNSHFRFQRLEKDYCRQDLIAILHNWGEQENLTSTIVKLEHPILWIAGKNDTKYASIATSMTLQHKLSKVWIAPNASHRVPWECADSFTEQVGKFTKRILYDYCDQTTVENDLSVSRH